MKNNGGGEKCHLSNYQRMFRTPGRACDNWSAEFILHNSIEAVCKSRSKIYFALQMPVVRTNYCLWEL